MTWENNLSYWWVGLKTKKSRQQYDIICVKYIAMCAWKDVHQNTVIFWDLGSITNWIQAVTAHYTHRQDRLPSSQGPVQNEKVGHFIQKLKISRQWEQSIEPSVELFWAQGQWNCTGRTPMKVVLPIGYWAICLSPALFLTLQRTSQSRSNKPLWTLTHTVIYDVPGIGRYLI